MSPQLSVFTTNLGARITIGLSVSATVIALLSGYQKPSNAAIIFDSTTSAVPTLTTEQLAEEKFRLGAGSDDKPGLDIPGLERETALERGCNLIKNISAQNSPKQICRLKAS